MADMILSAQPSYYKILGLPQTGTILGKQDLKTAYHRALLIHHPDKTLHDYAAPFKPTKRRMSGPVFTVDEITHAFKILSDPEARADYDKRLKLQSSGQTDTAKAAAHEGVERHDLQDLQYDETFEFWYKGCRCGDDRGYMITEPELERESHSGEIYVGCRGCSLFIKVLFAAADGNEDTKMSEDVT